MPCPPSTTCRQGGPPPWICRSSPGRGPSAEPVAPYTICQKGRFGVVGIASCVVLQLDRRSELGVYVPASSRRPVKGGDEDCGESVGKAGRHVERPAAPLP